jgi:hypothetical protein
MPFDKSLDKQIFSESKDIESTRITVSVMSYNEGEKKLQISRENKDASENYRFSKLGRMSKSEIEAILPAIQKAVENM